tara:strand:- start:11414 stop:11911 length:498 start_codon:yes stop_codon:yes gene_type:complete
MNKESSLVSSDTLSKLWGVTVRRVQQLAKEDIIPSPDQKNQYNFAQCNLYYIRFLRQAQRKIVTDDEKELRLRKLQAETQIAEADAEKALGNVVLVEDIKKRDEGLFDALRAGVIQIPSKLCSEMAIENDPNVIQAEFKEIINNLLLSFQKSVISYAEDIKKQVE